MANLTITFADIYVLDFPPPHPSPAHLPGNLARSLSTSSVTAKLWLTTPFSPFFDLPQMIAEVALSRAYTLSRF